MKLVNANDNFPDRLLKIEDLMTMTSLERGEIQQAAFDGKLPAPVALGPSLPRWRVSEITDWIRSLPLASSS